MALLSARTSIFMASRKANSDRGFSSLNAAHEQICASFLGPKAENYQILNDKFAAIAQDVLVARERFFPDDPTFIDPEIMLSEAYTNQVQKIGDYLDVLNKMLTKHCIPFFSPRYNGHMVSDASMPAILGYLVGLFWNQNNVTPEASPITSHVEYLVGQQICRMLGYRSLYDPTPLIVPPPPIGWGHITCDGSVANLESTWVARNLKFYPLSLQLAVKEGLLSFVASTFVTTLCNGNTKKLVDCSAWELLNLSVDEILNLPSRLVNAYGISTNFIESAVGDYLISNTGKEVLERRFQIKPPQMMVSVANHYSWPKSTALTGIGQANLIHIEVDVAARMNIARLDEHLAKCLSEQQAVYAVVSIMGTTEHGAVDPLFEVLRLREEYEKQGLSFYVHVDAAWGGYFASMLERPSRVIIPTGPNLPPSDIVLQQPLSEYTQNQLFSIQFADSCTIDPHKAGFIPYPAGCLCYRDERLRFMVTMTAAYINTTADVDNVGTYGVEGSKPGAAATAVWMAHHAIGLHHRGYGSLLGEAMYTAVKMYCNWTTMTFKEPNLIVKTLAMIPSEQKGLPQPEVDKEMQYILDKIVDQPNSEIIHDPEVMKKISELGGDLIITVFACNFHIGGVVNEDVTEANFFNRRLFERFSVTKREDDPYTRELIVGSTSLEEGTYGVALEKFKERLGLKSDGDLTVMTLVPMSPFPTAHNLVKSFADTFKAAAIEEIEECYTRIIPSPAQHSFVMQGTDELFLSYVSVFNIGSYRQQVILAARLPEEAMKLYAAEAEKDPAALFILTTEKALLSEILSNKTCRVKIYKGLDTQQPRVLVVDAILTDIDVIINRSIAPRNLDKSYPEFMPFYLYGSGSQYHIDHMLLLSPNTQLAAGRVKFNLEPPIYSLGKGRYLSGLIAIADTTREIAMQPFNADHKPTFFTAGRELPVTIYQDPNSAESSGPGLLKDLGSPLSKGTMILPPGIYIDYTLVNQEHGVALSTKHSKVNAPGIPDISHHIGMPSIGERYNMTPIDMSAVYNDLVAHHPADKYGYKMAIRKGWRDEFDEAMAKKHLKKM